MKNIHLLTYTTSLLLFLCILFSCKKDTALNPSASKNQDTLGIGWQKIAIDSGETMIDIWFSGNIGFGVSQYKIYRSKNGGNSWDSVFSFRNIYYNNLSMGDENNVIVTSQNSNILLYSNNQGATFDTATVKDSGINEVFFASKDVAYAIGKYVWKTTDAGRRWEKVYTLPQSSTFIYPTIYFIDDLKGWITSLTKTGLTCIQQTKDGGKNWQILDSSNVKYQYCTLAFIDENNGYINSNSNSDVSKTTDGGAKWTKIKDNDPTSSYFPDSHFFTKDYGYVNDKKHIYKTINGGMNFTTEVALGANNDHATVIELYFTDPNHGWACGYTGYILKYEKL